MFPVALCYVQYCSAKWGNNLDGPCDTCSAHFLDTGCCDFETCSTGAPTADPSAMPTGTPTVTPSATPSDAPTATPSDAPTAMGDASSACSGLVADTACKYIPKKGKCKKAGCRWNKKKEKCRRIKD